MKKHLKIAFDGPVASGKSTIARETAKKLGFLYIDTGAMYRAVTWLALKKGGDMENEAYLTETAQRYPVTLLTDEHRPEGYKVLIDGADITDEITSPAVNRWVSPVAKISGVRKILVRRQQDLARSADVVMAGRDITTVVLPDADLKIYLDASVDERARRRHLEEQSKGMDTALEKIRESLLYRDRIDSSREDSPLRVADDAVVLDSTGKTIEEVIDRVAEMVEKL